MADDEGEEAEIFVLGGVDAGLAWSRSWIAGGILSRRKRWRGRSRGRAVVAEHADESWGAFGRGKGGAGGDEWVEDVRV